jgi:hypothetical protein
MSDPTTRPAPTTDDPAKAVVYRPLSLLAVVGCGLAGLFAVVVIPGGVIAFLRGDPWLLPSWTVLLPIVAGVVSVLGILQVQRSEGTLAGEKVARWGLLLSVLVGFGYWAYYGATYFAISREADRVGRDFVDKLITGKDEDTLLAFRMTLPPEQRPAVDGDLRNQIERRFNNLGEMKGKGLYASFAQQEYVRILALGGARPEPRTLVETEGIDDWKYLGGGYQVQMLYHVATPFSTFKLQLFLQGKEGKRGEGRQWYVVWERSGKRQDQPEKFSDDGTKLFEVVGQAYGYIDQYVVQPLKKQRGEVVVVETKPLAEREAIRKTAERAPLSLFLVDMLGQGAGPCATPASVIALAAMATDADCNRAAAVPGYDAFRAGDLLRADKDRFWAPQDTRDEMLALIHEHFRHPDELLAALLRPDASSKLPVVRYEGNRLSLGFDVSLRVPLAYPRYTVEGCLYVDCNAAEAATGSVKSWHLDRVELISGKAMPAPQRTLPGDLKPPSPAQ